MKLAYSSRFLRSLEKLPRDIRELFRVKEVIFTIDPFDPLLRTHKLKGRVEWAFLVTYEIRVIFVWRNNEVLFVHIGDHSIYRQK